MTGVTEGAIIYNETTNAINYFNGSIWDNVGTGIEVYTQAAIDALTGVTEGAVVYNTDTDRLNSYDGSAWFEVGIEFVGNSSYSPADPDALETDYPAASNSGRWAMVWAGDARDGLYRSNGTLWIKLVDDSGDRTTLWDYAAGITYDAVNIATTSATFKVTENDLVTNITGAGSNNLTMLNDNVKISSNYFGIPVAKYGNANIFSQFASTPPKVGKFIITAWGGTNDDTTTFNGFEIIGISGGVAAVITPTSVSGNAQIVGSQIQRLGGSTFTRGTAVTVYTGNTVQYDNYGMKIYSGGTSRAGVCEIEMYEIINLSDSIDCVNSINKLNAGRQASQDLAAATLTIDATDGFIDADATSASITIYLPACNAALPGKIYRIAKADVSVNTVTINANTIGGTTINGATTKVLNDQYDLIEIIDTGTEYRKTADLLIKSQPVGVTGADSITNVISLTQAEYNAITPNATTLYIING